MDATYKRYLISITIAIVVVYALAHVDVLREKVLGLPALSA